MQYEETANKLKKSIGENVKMVADELHYKPPTLYKWMDATVRNPLALVLQIIEATNDETIIEFLCKKCDGYFVPNIHEYDENSCINKVLSEMGDIIKIMAEANKDNYICQKELDDIEESCANLKSKMDVFCKTRKAELNNELFDDPKTIGC